MDLLAPPPDVTPAPSPTPDVTPAPGLIPDAPAPIAGEFTNALPENWHIKLGDKYAQESDTLGKFKSVEDLAKSFLHFRKTGPAYPDDNSPPQDIERFRLLAKVPTDPTGYGLKKPESLPEGVLWDDGVAAELAAVAHKYHVPAPALQALADAQAAAEIKQAEKYNAEQAVKQAEIQKEVQSLFGTGHEYERNTSNLRHLVSTLADKANIDPQDPSLSAIFGNAAAIKILHQVALMTQEDGMKRPGGFSDMRGGQQQASDIMKGIDPVWGAKYKAGDPEAIKRVERLLQSK